MHRLKCIMKSKIEIWRVKSMLLGLILALTVLCSICPELRYNRLQADSETVIVLWI